MVREHASLNYPGDDQKKTDQVVVLVVAQKGRATGSGGGVDSESAVRATASLSFQGVRK
jgi:hypothetical protein